jgi:ketosteroid isomerase-like protein
LWWADWAETWDSYVYRISEYRDLGDWVLTLTDVRARGRGGIPVEMRTFELWQPRDGKIARYRAFLTEQEALEAVGLSEQDAHADSP